MAEYHLSPAAQSDLQQIFDYTLREWGLEQALLYDQKLESACSALADSQAVGLECTDVRAGYRRHFVGRHVIYFRRTDYGVVVIRILHGNMDPLERV